MFDIDNYPEILNFLHSSCFIGLKTHNTEKFKYSILCNYCDDSYRKDRKIIKHGHLHISKNIPFFRCLRCETGGHLSVLLNDLKFPNTNIINEIRNKSNNFILIHNSKKKYEIYTSDIYKTNEIFMTDYSDYYSIFQNYIKDRIGDINYLDFGLYPTLKNNNLFLNFNNFNNEFCNSRVISGNYKKRYCKNNNPAYYYFQNIDEIYDFKNIVICEGEIDLINLYFYGNFTNTFYISVGGKNYPGILNFLIRRYLIIGKFDINIILDNDYRNIDRLKYTLKKIINKFNPKLNLYYHIPNKKFKDISQYITYYQI